MFCKIYCWLYNNLLWFQGCCFQSRFFRIRHGTVLYILQSQCSTDDNSHIFDTSKSKDQKSNCNIYFSKYNKIWVRNIHCTLFFRRTRIFIDRHVKSSDTFTSSHNGNFHIYTVMGIHMGHVQNIRTKSEMDHGIDRTFTNLRAY